MAPLTGILQSNPLYGKIQNVILAHIEKWVTPVKKAWKTDQENGMVYYVGMYGCRDIELWKSEKMLTQHYSPFLYDIQTSISQEPLI